MKESATPAWAARYYPGDYPVFGYTADTVPLSVSTDLQRLRACTIIRGADGPYAGMPAIPGGFVQWRQDSRGIDAAARELNEETGLIMEPAMLESAASLADSAPPTGPKSINEASYIEELKTYDENGRDPRQWVGNPAKTTGVRIVSKAHIALFKHPSETLTPEAGEDAVAASWCDIYDFLPWECLQPPDGLQDTARLALDALTAWAREADTDVLRRRRRTAVDRAFGNRFADWNEERAPERFALMFQAGLLEEAHRDRWGAVTKTPVVQFGRPLAFDHRMMLADALGRVRSKMKYIPAVLEALVPSETFTLRDLQSVCEVIGGRPLYRQNFPRVIADSKTFRIVESTGKSKPTGHRGPAAQMYRFPRDVRDVRLDPSIRMPWAPLTDIVE